MGELVEQKTQRIGREIFDRIRALETGGRFGSRQWIDRTFMGKMMEDRELRYRMLRFIDVYPSLRDSKDIASHLQEYLTSPSLSIGADGSKLLSFARSVAGPGIIRRAPISWASRYTIETMGRRFIAGENPEAVAPKIRALEKEGYAFSLDLLGEFVSSEPQADEFQRRYLDMISRLPQLLGPAPRAGSHPKTGPRVNLSIKLSSLTSKFDAMDWEGTAAAVLRRLRPIFRAAREHGVFINIDMEKYEYRDMTLEIIKRLLSEEEFRGFEHVGTVVQAYLADAEESLETFLNWIREQQQPITLRLVKGAYWDSEQIWASQRGWAPPVLTDKRETDAQFERMTRTLLENSTIVRTAIGSHNVRSIAHAIALSDSLGVDMDSFEAQMLYGMAGPIGEAVADMGVPVRIYVPCGELIPGMAYLVRRILENTANESFLRQRFVEHADEALLLADPKEAHHG